MKLNPCIESLADMIPNKEGRYCGSCSKTIVDLTEKTDSEIHQIYLDQGGNLCGIVKPNQLRENKHYHPLKRFALALLLVFGSTLFVISCNGNFDFESFKNSASIQLTAEDSSHIVKGFVYAHEEPVEGATITFTEDEIVYLATTDAEGKFELRLPDLKQSSIELRISSEGYLEIKKEVQLKDITQFIGKIRLQLKLENCKVGKIAPPIQPKVQGNIEMENVEIQPIPEMIGDIDIEKKQDSEFD